MPDLLTEFRDSLQRLAERTFGEMTSTQGVEPASAVVAAHNPLGAAEETDVMDDFSTGYSGGETTTAAIFNLSNWGGGDQFVGS